MLYIVRVFEGAAVYEYEYGLIEHAEKHLEMERCYAELYEWQKGNEVFVKAVNENVGNIVVSAVKTADVCIKSVIGKLDVIFGNINKLCAVLYVESEILTLFDADNVALFCVNGGIDKLNDLLGLAGTSLTHNYLNHSILLPSLK